MVPYYREQIHLSRVIERMLCTLFSPRSNMDGMSRRACLDTLNIELCRWKAALPGRAEWNKWEPIDTPLIPSVAMLQSVPPSSCQSDSLPATAFSSTAPA